jgi:hypothetical protein
MTPARLLTYIRYQIRAQSIWSDPSVSVFSAGRILAISKTLNPLPQPPHHLNPRSALRLPQEFLRLSKNFDQFLIKITIVALSSFFAGLWVDFVTLYPFLAFFLFG